ncbi:MAG: NUDIX hydrolase [Ruminococcaceae bacterium]|nr:NUDIX hydrolase [Oscillospiraceae bacterium]
MNLIEKTIKQEQIFEGKIITLRRDTVKLPNGNEATREVVEHPGGVAVVALDEHNEVYMVRQFRYPFGEVISEIPAGKLDAGEDPFDCCVRELAEETGLSAGHYDYLGKFMLSPGFCREWIHIYLARDLTTGDAHLDADEFLEVEKRPLVDLVEQVMNNELTDAKTVMGILKTNELLRRERNRA